MAGKSNLKENMTLASAPAVLDNIFSTEESRQDAKLQKVYEIPLSEIRDFPNHPYKVRDDDAMTNLTESIKQRGVQVPVLVRPHPDGGYEMVSGHRRKRASVLAGYDTVPTIIKEMTDDEAIVLIRNNIVRVKNIHEKKPKNKASCCSMPLLPIVKVFLERLRIHQAACAESYGSAYEENDYVVKRNCGKQPTLEYLNKRLQATLLRLKETTIVTQHQLRHSTATLLRSIGMEDSTIQSWLRHADIKSTMHYAHDDGLTVKIIAGEQMNNIFILEPQTKIVAKAEASDQLKEAV